ncbi:hypothetical protein CDO73_21325 [Saccharibacillus sp. O23]|nr:hypothetical protein CDO73_21325 [Saccharibacillus sp. O23]
MEVLYENRSAQELAEKIFEIFAAFFGKEFDKTLEECERVANEIIGLRTSFIHIEARLHRESTQLFKRTERDY